MNVNDDLAAQVMASLEEQPDGLLLVPSDEFWGHFGVEDKMKALREEITEKLAEYGINVSFDVELTLLQPELPQFMEFDVSPRPEPLDLNVETVRALSIQQPWVEMILRGEKNLEYRSRRMREMGPLLLHASGTLVSENFGDDTPVPETLPFRALVGIVDVVGVIEVEGEDHLFAYQLAHPRRFKRPVPYSGAAGIFRVPVSELRAALQGGIELQAAKI